MADRIVTINLDELARVLRYPYTGNTGEPVDGSIILVDEATAYVRTDEPAKPDRAAANEYDAAPGAWWQLDGTDGGGRPWSLGEILGHDEVPEDRVPHTYELLYSADDVLRLVESLVRIGFRGVSHG